MPYKCCVPNCRGNYDNGPKVSTFSFPRDELLRQKGVKAICREKFSPTNNTKVSGVVLYFILKKQLDNFIFFIYFYFKVCQLHFRQDEIELETSIYTSEGKKLTAPLRHPRLKEGLFY